MAPKMSVHIKSYFDFLCPWCYIGKIRLEKAIREAKIKTETEWVPFELYAHQDEHVIHREHIHSHEHLDKIYQQLTPIAAKEKIIIRQHSYERSSRRALTGILFAREHGKIEEYMRCVYAEVFEYGNDISSLMVLGKIALKLGWNVEAFLRYIDDSKNQNNMVHLSETSKRSGIHGVPTYVINGYTLAGTIPAHELAQLLLEHSHPSKKIISTPKKPKSKATHIFKSPKRKSKKPQKRR